MNGCMHDEPGTVSVSGPHEFYRWHWSDQPPVLSAVGSVPPISHLEYYFCQPGSVSDVTGIYCTTQEYPTIQTDLMRQVLRALLLKLLRLH
jgi:hypothetical protein